jgi:membrane-associated protease RseP (regulator of RpoE activity)
VNKEEGILVREVLPESPAAKAGLKAEDVVVKVGKKTMREPANLIAAIQASKEKTLTFEVLRDGKRQSFTVTPTEAPKGYAEAQEPLKPGRERLFGERMERPFFRMFGGPEVNLPDDMTVTITKSGKKPAQVVVKQGDKKWEASEKKLDRLPGEVRPYAEQMLGHGPAMGPRIVIGPTGEVGNWPMPKMPPQGMVPGVRPAVEKRLEEMNSRIDKLQKMVEELQKERKEKR